MKHIHLFGFLLVCSLVLGGPVGAAPSGGQQPPAGSPSPARVTAPVARPAQPAARPAQPAAKPAQPVAKPAQPVAQPGVAPAGAATQAAPAAVIVEPPSRLPANFDPVIDLKRLGIGNQAGLLKVFARDTGAEAYFRTLDDRNTAFFTAEQRQALYAALALAPEEVELAARQVMVGYPKLPKRAVLAFLGAVGSDPDLAPEFQALLQRYLAERYSTEKDNILRRQALLSLALMHRVDAESVELVLQVFETEPNLWVTFPVQMFFEHHAGMIQELAHVEAIRGRAGAVNSLYTENVLKALGAPASPVREAEPAPSAAQADPGGAALPPATGAASF